MYQVEYTSLKYYNSAISEECLYIGILFHNITNGQRDFKYISNFSRFQAFDDDADIIFVKAYLNGIKNDVENNVLNYKNFDIKGYIKIFVNEFRFTDIRTIEVEENDQYKDDLTKLYLKYDFSRKNRLNANDEKKYIRKILESNNISFLKPQTTGDYQEEISFDYIINDLGIKVFSFKDKNLKRMIPAAKQWSFTAEELSKSLNTIFLYQSDSKDAFHLNIILKILKKHATVLPLNDGLDYILKKTS